MDVLSAVSCGQDLGKVVAVDLLDVLDPPVEPGPMYMPPVCCMDKNWKMTGKGVDVLTLFLPHGCHLFHEPVEAKTLLIAQLLKSVSKFEELEKRLAARIGKAFPFPQGRKGLTWRSSCQ